MSARIPLDRDKIADRTAPFMFGLSLLFLAGIAALIVLWVDMSRIEQSAANGELASSGLETAADMWSGSQAQGESNGRAAVMGNRLLLVIQLLWLAFAVEWVYQALSPQVRGRRMWGRLPLVICPPLRLAASHPDKANRIWLPRLGWCQADDVLRRRLEKSFGVPMIIIAAMILPILLVEFRMQEQIANHSWLRFLLHVSAGVIWFAFALEFVVMCQVAEKRMRYCKEHWLDLAIILLPLISFLRSLRVVRSLRIARLAKVQHLTKMSRMYRLRGLAMRGFRALLMLELMHRVLLITPEKKLRSLRRQLEEKEAEAAALRRRIEALESRTASERTSVATENAL